MGDLFEALTGIVSPWGPKYFALRDKALEGTGMARTRLADLVHSLEDILRLSRTLVLYAPGPAAIQPKDDAESLTLRGWLETGLVERALTCYKAHCPAVP